jgi:hypothetical protein
MVYRGAGWFREVGSCVHSFENPIFSVMYEIQNRRTHVVYCLGPPQSFIRAARIEQPARCSDRLFNFSLVEKPLGGLTTLNQSVGALTQSNSVQLF